MPFFFLFISPIIYDLFLEENSIENDDFSTSQQEEETAKNDGDEEPESNDRLFEPITPLPNIVEVNSARLTEDLNISQQKLERLTVQLQAEQNRTILAEQTVTKYMTEIRAIKEHHQQVSSYLVICLEFMKR